MKINDYFTFEEKHDFLRVAEFEKFPFESKNIYYYRSKNMKLRIGA
jgi:hypothetical protein